MSHTWRLELAKKALLPLGWKKDFIDLSISDLSPEDALTILENAAKSGLRAPADQKMRLCSWRPEEKWGKD